jgi:predicted dehydrogenase
MKIAVVGLGYWGPNLVRNFIGTEGVTEVGCFDLNAGRVKKLVTKNPQVRAFATVDELLTSDYEAIVVATPVSTHHPIGMRALEHGKHILLEKPMAASVKECDELNNLAAKQGLRVMVDHTFVYTGAVRKIKEIISTGLLGEIYYFDSVRVNLGLFQHDVNVVWDLAPHDISIMDYVIPLRPVAVSAVGVHHVNGHEDVAYLTVHFENEVIAHFHVNWLAPVKIRRILIGGSRQMIVYDDMQPSEKVRVYDKGVEITSEEGIYKTLVQYRTGDMYAPKIEESEALGLLTKEFVQSINESRPALTDGRVGANVVRVLEAAERSMKEGGKLTHLSQAIEMTV